MEGELAADWSEQTHHQTRNNHALDHNKKARNRVTNTSGNHKLLKQSETLIAAKTDSSTVENKILSSSLNVHSKPFEPDYALHFADVRVKGEHNEIADCLGRPPDINAVFQNWKTVDLTEIAIAQSSDHNLTALIHNSPANLNCVQMTVPDSNSLIWVDISTGAARVLVLECMRKRVFD